MSRLIATNLHRIKTPAMNVRVAIPFFTKGTNRVRRHGVMRKRHSICVIKHVASPA